MINVINVIMPNIYRNKSLIKRAGQSVGWKLFCPALNPSRRDEDHDSRVPEAQGFGPELPEHFLPLWRDPEIHISAHPHPNHLKNNLLKLEFCKKSGKPDS